MVLIKIIQNLWTFTLTTATSMRKQCYTVFVACCTSTGTAQCSKWWHVQRPGNLHIVAAWIHDRFDNMTLASNVWMRYPHFWLMLLDDVHFICSSSFAQSLPTASSKTLNFAIWACFSTKCNWLTNVAVSNRNCRNCRYSTEKGGVYLGFGIAITEYFKFSDETSLFSSLLDIRTGEHRGHGRRIFVSGRCWWFLNLILLKILSFWTLVVWLREHWYMYNAMYMQRSNHYKC